MATVDFEVGAYSTNRGSGAGTVIGKLRLSGQDTITTVENLEDASGDITVARGEVIAFYSDAKLRVDFGGSAATATTGHIVPPNAWHTIEVSASGTVSVIEAT